MNKRKAAMIGFAIGAVLLVPVALLMQWFGFVPAGWSGFLVAYATLAVISISFEYFERWIEGRLQRRANTRRAIER